MTDLRQQILAALKDFDTYPLPEAATRLFATLGYKSDRVLPISTVTEFCSQWDGDRVLSARERETLDQLTALHFLFQIKQACPGGGRDWIQTLLTEWKSEGRVSCAGKGPAARWRLVSKSKGSTPK